MNTICNICNICNDKNINTNNRCKKCKKSVCNECYCKMSNLLEQNDVINVYYFNYCCPFCRNKDLQETERTSGKNIINILGNNFNSSLKYIKENYDSTLMDLISSNDDEIERLKISHEKKIDTYKSITEYYKKKNIELTKENEKNKERK